MAVAGFAAVIRQRKTIRVVIPRSEATWESREGSCVFADSCPTIQPGTARLPRARSALAMTSLGALHIRRKYLQICSCQRRSLTAATDAIGAYRFHGGLYKSAVPSRDCHVASLLAMTNLEALTAHIASLHGGHCPMDKSDIPGFARSDIFLSESDIKASRLL